MMTYLEAIERARAIWGGKVLCVEPDRTDGAVVTLGPKIGLTSVPHRLDRNGHVTCGHTLCLLAERRADGLVLTETEGQLTREAQADHARAAERGRRVMAAAVAAVAAIKRAGLLHQDETDAAFHAICDVFYGQDRAVDIPPRREEGESSERSAARDGGDGGARGGGDGRAGGV